MFSPDAESANTMILNFSTFITVRNKCLLFVSHPGFGLLQHPEWTEPSPYIELSVAETQSLFSGAE